MKDKFIYSDIMKKARNLYKNIGITYVIFLALLGFAVNYVFLPLMGKLWSLLLKTTPEGFISFSNITSAILKSPWIIPAAIAYAAVYVVLALWQTSAVMTGVGYAHQGRRIRLWDLFRISFLRLGGRKLKDNWLILVYTLIIIPVTNIYRTDGMFSVFSFPEFIQDFIDAKPVLFILFVIALLAAVFLALRWFFILPSFFIRKKSFREAAAENKVIASKKFIKNWVNLIIYSLVEFIRLSVVPIVLILVPVTVGYLATYRLEFASRLFGTMGISWGLELCATITGMLVQISVMCFLTELYFKKLKEYGMDDAAELPTIGPESRAKISVNVLQLVCSAVFSAFILAAYLITVNTAQTDSGIILELFGQTEIIAHKGYSSEAPENTMPAFKLADECEAVSYIEIDVWSTKDGVPVVLHNASIKDATGVDRLVYECTYDEIKDLQAPYAMSEEEFPDARIPSLEEVIETYAGSTPLIIEIKGFKEDPELPAKIVALMKQYGCEKTSLIQSGNYGALKAVKEADPDIGCGLILTFVTGNYYDMPYADFFSIEHNFIDGETVDNLHRRGKKVFAWTVNYAESAESLQYLGVDGIITDYPDDMNEYFADANELVKKAWLDSFTKQFDSESRKNAAQLYEAGEY